MNMTKYIYLLLFLGLSTSSFAGVTSLSTTQLSRKITFVNSDFHTYSSLTKFLSTYVSSNGNVNYAGIKKNYDGLKKVLIELKNNSPKSDWSRNQKLAYWINVYNMYTIKLVVDHYPISSITKITAKPWDKKFITIDGKTYSLNDIEHNIIRAKYNEPRIHFALNCASASCPKLLNKAYTASNLSAQLTRQTKAFLSDKSKNDFSNSSSIKISKIFDWYKGDFTKNGGSVVSFINKYQDAQLNSPKIGYMEYSWELNK